METELAQAVHIYLYMPVRLRLSECVCMFVCASRGFIKNHYNSDDNRDEEKSGQKIEVRKRKRKQA